MCRYPNCEEYAKHWPTSNLRVGQTVTIPLCKTHFRVMGIVYDRGYVSLGEIEAREIMES